MMDRRNFIFSAVAVPVAASLPAEPPTFGPVVPDLAKMQVPIPQLWAVLLDQQNNELSRWEIEPQIVTGPIHSFKLQWTAVDDVVWNPTNIALFNANGEIYRTELESKGPVIMRAEDTLIINMTMGLT